MCCLVQKCGWQFCLLYHSQYRAAAQAARDATPSVMPPRILSIQISVLARSTNNAQSKAIDPEQSFYVRSNRACF